MDHKSGQIGISRHHADVSSTKSVNLFQQGTIGIQHLGNPFHHCIEGNSENTVKKCVLGLEIVVQQAFVDTRSIGNFLHTGSIKALLLKNVARRLQNSELRIFFFGYYHVNFTQLGKPAKQVPK